MYRSAKHALMLAAALAAGASSLLLSPAPAVHAQEADEEPGTVVTDGDRVVLNPKDGGWTIEELFQSISRSSNVSILYDKNNAIIKGKQVLFIGKHIIGRDDLFNWLQAVLSFHGLVLVPVGPPGSDGRQQWFALDQANANLTSRPRYLEEDQVLDFADRDGLYVVTSFQLQHIKDASRVRQALSQLSTKTAGLGRINDIPGSRALIVGDFAPIVASMKRLLKYIDVENTRIEPRMEIVQLNYAVASEMEPLLQELIEQSEIGQPQPRGRQPAGVDDEPPPKIIADPRLDALIIYAVDRHMNKIMELIKKLDVPNNNYRQRIHFRPLRHSDATELADLIRELIEDTGIGGGSTRRSTGRRTTSRNQPTPGAQPGAFGGTGSEGEPVIIADTRSNSLIVHASPTQFDAIDDLITKLDTSRPQVLIETALVELTLSDQFRLSTELFATSDDVGVDTDGDGVADTLTDERKYFTSQIFGSDPITRTVGDVTFPVSLAPGAGTGFTAGIFKDGRVPFLLTAFRSSGRAKILTMPSVVTNDNSQATVALSRTTSFRQTVRDETGTSTDSFETVTATTNLTISPTIASDNYLRLTIDQSVENFGSPPSEGAPPDQTSRSVNTTVTVPDRYTVVLGGLVQQEERSSVTKVPFLGDLPLLGWLFRSTDDSSNPSHLFLFVTPRILSDTETFLDYHRLTWERKLLQDDLFGSEVRFTTGNFYGPNEKPSVQDRLDALELSGELDGARLKAPPTEAQRIDEARRAAGADAVRLPPPPKNPNEGE